MATINTRNTDADILNGFKIMDEILRRVRAGETALLSFGFDRSETGEVRLFIDVHEGELQRAADVVFGGKRPSEEGC